MGDGTTSRTRRSEPSNDTGSLPVRRAPLELECRRALLGCTLRRVQRVAADKGHQTTGHAELALATRSVSMDLGGERQNTLYILFIFFAKICDKKVVVS